MRQGGELLHLPLDKQLLVYQHLVEDLGLLSIHITKGGREEVQECLHVILE